MSNLQKWCPNYTQVCTLAKPGGCLYTVRWGTPHVSPPLGAQFLCWHQTSLGEYSALTRKYWFYLPTCLLQGRGGQKLRGMKTPVCWAAKTWTTTATARQKP